jgi:hypothetical protein
MDEKNLNLTSMVITQLAVGDSVLVRLALTSNPCSNVVDVRLRTENIRQKDKSSAAARLSAAEKYPFYSPTTAIQFARLKAKRCDHAKRSEKKVPLDCASSQCAAKARTSAAGPAACKTKDVTFSLIFLGSGR